MRGWLLGLGLLCLVPSIGSATAAWPGVSWPDVGGGGTTVENYTIGTWYVNEGTWWSYATNNLCMRSIGAAGIWLCSVYDEMGIPFSSPGGINIVDLTCTLDPASWTTASEFVDLEVAIHVPATDGGDIYGTATGVITRLLSDGTAPKVFSSGDSTYTSSITEGYLTLQSLGATNLWTSNGSNDIVQAICSIEVN